MKKNKTQKAGAILCMAVLLLFLREGGGESVVLAKELTDKEILTHTGPIVTGDKEPEYPSEEMEWGGKTYHLVSATLHHAAEKGEQTYVTNSISYELEGRQEPPETAMMTLVDEQTGEEYSREVKRLGMTERDSVWSEDFSFSITVTGYDAEAFFLGDREIPADADLSSYGTEFLSYLELPEDCYRIDQITWSGESYEKDGVLCRDAVAAGVKLIRTVEVTYGGQVRTPDVRGKRYISVYEEVIPEPEPIRIPEDVLPVPEETTISESIEEDLSLFQTITRWMREHLTVVTVSLAFIVGIFGCLVLLWLKHRRDKKSREN